MILRNKFNSFSNFDLSLQQLTLFLLNTTESLTDTTEVVVLVALCLLFSFISAVCSGGEQAFLSMNQKDLNMLKARSDIGARRIPLLLEQPRILSATLLIAHTISNLFLIFILNALLDLLVSVALFPALSIFVKILVIFFLLFLFCETLPRAYARQKKMRTAFFCAPILNSLINIFEPLASAMINASDWLSKQVFRKKNDTLSIKDLDRAFAVSLNHSAGMEEKNILRSLMQFEDITVRQIMKTRMDICGIPEDLTFRDLIAQIPKLHYSRLPVYAESLDQIIGIIHVKDLLPHVDKEALDWHSLIKQPVFVPEKKRIKSLLQDFQTQHFHFAVVVDEFGGTSGIVTMEDIMEEIVGDIRDEFDTDEPSHTQINENEYLFEGKTMLNEVGRILDLPTNFFDGARGESDSLGGLILELSGNFPDINETISFQGLELIPLEIKDMRIKKIKIIIKGR